MKIYINTLLPNANFGAYMQGYTISRFLSELGHDVTFFRKNDYYYHMPDEAINNVYFRKRSEGYLAFERKYFKFTDLVNTAHEYKDACKDADLIITGSDQVWSNSFIGYRDISLNCLNFARNSKALIASYAASVGSSIIGEDSGLADFFARNLDHFDYMSIREPGTEKDFKRILGFTCETVIDPTFLLDFAEYEKFIEHPPIREKYIYLHSEYRYNPKIERLGAELSQLTGLPILNNHTAFASRKMETFDHPDQIAKGYHFNQQEVINAIYYAEYIITTSFHCTCIANIFKKNFYSVTKKHFSSNRQNHLLNRLGMLERAIDENTHFEKIMPISDEQWITQRINLWNFRKKSIDYIMNITSGVKRKKKDYFEGTNEFHCFSCSACADICPVSAISMMANKEGFFMPEVNKEKCSNCGLCKNVCQFNNVRNEKQYVPNAYLAYNLDEYDLKHSSSGGMYPALAKYVLKQGGHVVGVKYDYELNVTYDIANTQEDAYAFRYSKYVEPLHGNIYNKTKSALDNGNLVLFTGSPCKIAGLKNYLGKDYDKLITVDVICHGAASPLAYRSFLKSKSLMKGSNIVNICFRDPELKQGGRNVTFTYADGTVENDKDNIYQKAYLADTISRKSCYLCPYTQQNNLTDFTIGDFWNWAAHYDNPNGKPISALIVNTPKAKEIFNEIKTSLYVQPVDVKACYKKNHAYAAGISPKRTNLLNDLAAGKDAIKVFTQALDKK